MKRIIIIALLLLPISSFSQTKFDYLGDQVITFNHTGDEKYYPNKNNHNDFQYTINHKQIIVPQNQCWIITEFFLNDNGKGYASLAVCYSAVYKDGKFIGYNNDGTPNYYLQSNSGKQITQLPLVMTKSFSIEYLGGAGYIYVRKFSYGY